MMGMPHILAVLIVGTTILFSAGCSTNESIVEPEKAETIPQTSRLPDYVIQPGDELEIKFFYNPELNERISVRPDGKISLQLVDEIMAAGLTPSDLDALLTEIYAKELKKPEITVILRSFAGQRIYVGGEVSNESLIPLHPGMTALQAVFQAGGFLDTAEPGEAIVIRKTEDNRPTPIKVNLETGRSGVGSGMDFVLQPDDIIFIPRSAIADANLFVNQYVERLLLFRGVSLGFSYEIKGSNN